MQEIFEFRSPPSIIFGKGSIKRLPDKLKESGYTKSFIITDKNISSQNFYADVLFNLKLNSIDVIQFDDISSEPSTKNVKDAIEMLGGEKDLCIVAIGGGSAIDCAKAVSVMASNPGDIVDYKGIEKFINDRIPLICIPTTAGTGSEVTRFTIITDPATNIKMLINSVKLIPDINIDDPELTYTMPPSITANTGIDALTHAIEAYISKKSTLLTDVFALSSISRIAGNLYKSWKDNDPQSREQVMLGQLEAGLAFSNSSVALIHGMSRPIGVYFHIPHGLANALLLPTVMEYSIKGDIKKFANIAKAVDDTITGTEKDLAEMSVKIVSKLCKDIKIKKIAELGIDKKKFFGLVEQMAQDALDSGSPANNPIVPQKEEIIKLYKELF